MKTRLPLSALIVTLSLAFRVQAAPLPNEAKIQTGPAVAVQVKSVEELAERLKSTKKFLPEFIYQELETNVISKLGNTTLKGIDTKKPAGMYVIIGPGLMQGDFSKSSIVAMVPVTNEKDFVDLLGKTELPIEKKGEVYAFPIPDSPLPIAVRFLKDHAYIGYAGNDLDPRLLLQPQDIINDDEKSAVVVKIRVDRIPGELKQAALEIVGQKFDEAKDKGATPEAKEFITRYLDTTLSWLRIGLNEGKELAFRFDLDAQTGAIVTEAALEPKKESGLAKTYAGLAPTTNEFASIVGPDSAAHVFMKAPLFFEDLRMLAGELIDLGDRASSQKVEKEARQMMAELFSTLRRTVKSGNVDLTASLRGPDKNDQYTAVGAFSLKDTSALEKSIKNAVKDAPKEVRDKIKFDAFKVDNVNVHEILVGDELPPEAQKIFSKSSVYVALAPDAAFASFGSHAKESIKEMLATKFIAKPTPLLQLEMSGKRLMPLMKSAGVPLEGEAKPFFEKFAKADRISAWTIKVEGGERLVVRQELGLVSMLWMMPRVAVGQAQAVPAQAVPAPVNKIEKIKKEVKAEPKKEEKKEKK